MDRIFVFLLGVPLGFIIMIYRSQLKQITGEIGFAEQYLGSGGTYTFYILLGIGIVFLSVSYAFGAFQDFFGSTFGMFFK
jgi:hypothetical protein